MPQVPQVLEPKPAQSRVLLPERPQVSLAASKQEPQLGRFLLTELLLRPVLRPPV